MSVYRMKMKSGVSGRAPVFLLAKPVKDSSAIPCINLPLCNEKCQECYRQAQCCSKAEKMTRKLVMRIIGFEITLQLDNLCTQWPNQRVDNKFTDDIDSIHILYNVIAYASPASSG